MLISAAFSHLENIVACICHCCLDLRGRGVGKGVEGFMRLTVDRSCICLRAWHMATAGLYRLDWGWWIAVAIAACKSFAILIDGTKYMMGGAWAV